MSEKHQIPSLDGVRGIAFLIVFGVHSRPQLFEGGGSGVDLFFVLSGFLITSLLLRELAQTGSINIKDFYKRRALRLLPALFLLVASVVIYAAVFQQPLFLQTLKDAAAVALYFWNWVRAFTYPTRDVQPMFGHLWSLSVEEQFYILWPFLVLWTAPFKRLFPILLLIGIVLPASLRMWLWESGPSLNLYFRTDLRFDSLMWGAAGAWTLIRYPNVPNYLPTIGLGMLIAFIAMSRVNLVSNGFVYLGGYTLIFAMAAILIVAACGTPSPLRMILEMSWLRWTGRVSYGLYLWHVPAFYVAHTHLDLGDYMTTVIATVATFAIAAASYYGVERHLLALRYSPLRGRKKPAFAAKP